jgi:hypothetical protein
MGTKSSNAKVRLRIALTIAAATLAAATPTAISALGNGTPVADGGGNGACCGGGP